MKKSVFVVALTCLALAGCAGTPAAAPTVTETVTATVTATATATVTAAPAPAPVVTPAAAIPTAAGAPATAIISANVAGMNAEALDDDLKALGFQKVVFNADTGKTVLLLSNWTVTGIDNPGLEQATSKAVVVHVTK
ncbi:hypothetical protein EU811_19670 [Arthrobacter sp. TS-15]|uniref:hypothetical protein n=1 Tax=Arthrobacter sp. TS-15 TaxID=2510797 RepID=UPI00115EB44B|nr:hypothetical protein [Arthrobacter sp. TS-15]TQS89626.1 hypothetical protein EU811_19670 [Arthrobacter sp. TS-15]